MSQVRVKWTVTLAGGEEIEVRAKDQREAAYIVRNMMPDKSVHIASISRA